jgi:tetratricopeptide (TPR) repeat protein
MRFRGIVVICFTLAATAAAQQPGSATSNSGPSSGGVTPGRGPSRQTQTFPDDTTLQQRPIFISGRVVLSDGGPLPDRVKIERVCNGTPRIEGYTDQKGRFGFELGRSMEMQDASSAGRDMMASDSPFAGARTTNGSNGQMGGIERSLWGCELRASLGGYRSDIVELSNIHYMDNPDVGTIILHRLGNVQGLTVSVTSELAPKNARKAYEKGLQAAGKQNPDEAQKEFEKAVQAYPKYAEAWVALGNILQQRDHIEEARHAYNQALAADSKLIQPYQQLSLLALKEAKWQDLADDTDKILSLDPYSYPDAYYLNSLANFQLRHFDVAEKNAREAVRLDPNKRNMRSRYILGLVLAQRQEFTASAESLHSFLDSPPEGVDLDMVRKQLSQIEEAAREKAQAPQQ